MKRHASLIPLSHDHHISLLLAMMLRKDAPAYKGMSSNPVDKAQQIRTHFSTHLAKHFDTEEKILFPFVKGRDKETDDLIDDLIKEHREITRGVIAINQTSDLENSLHALGELIDQHIRKEERVLFEKIPELFSEEELKQLENLIPKSKF